MVLERVYIDDLSSLTFSVLAIVLLVNPPAQQCKKCNDNNCTKNGFDYTATAITFVIHDLDFVVCIRDVFSMCR